MSKSTTKSKSATRRGTRAAKPAALARKANRVIDRAGRKSTGEVKSLSARLQTGIAGVKTRAKGIATAVSKQASRADKKIRAKPYQTIGVAAGAALVAGYLMARKRTAAAPAPAAAV
jgi:ElaB/YqjD/DUF883 family membrane-anchored ribosome-binding protein